MPRSKSGRLKAVERDDDLFDAEDSSAMSSFTDADRPSLLFDAGGRFITINQVDALLL
jgi:hypothetical protein